MSAKASPHSLSPNGSRAISPKPGKKDKGLLKPGQNGRKSPQKRKSRESSPKHSRRGSWYVPSTDLAKDLLNGQSLSKAMASAHSKLSNMKVQAKHLIHKPAAIFRQEWSTLTDSVEAIVPEQSPLLTPNSAEDPACELFKSNVWWMKGGGDLWHPCDKHVISKISSFEYKQDRLFGFWTNLITSETKNCALIWKHGDARISYYDVVAELDTVIGPSDLHWKLPLWLRAQRFEILCYDTPFCMDDPIKCDEHWLEETLSQSLRKSSSHAASPNSSTPAGQSRFLVVKCAKPFAPKPIYQKNPNS